MEHFQYQPGRSFDRRIGHRSATASMEVTWVLPESGLLRRERAHPGRIVELSLSGAAIAGPAAMKVALGSTVLVRYRNGDSSVIVRRRDPSDDPAVELYGVELVVIHPLLSAELPRGEPRSRPQGPSKRSPVDDGVAAPGAFAFGDVSAEAGEGVAVDAETRADRHADSDEPVTRAEAAADAGAPIVRGSGAPEPDDAAELTEELRRFLSE